ncbi:MAG: AtpZ/AtpI family protein [Candidatus Abyssobacteria bacterium SURF_5]|uniref:AtpZ/AtpI family protein n=1 Tax=Abyssobacteria bacterium (strain SURF_5) TaxID=2093360 RepID=A0A3A4NMI5_ABYX5|nr:MAG: AtpZ/AtpI family protein [Candidatus Abyssubacteria bacterium SURF_5]
MGGTSAAMNRDRNKFLVSWGIAFTLSVEMAVAVIVPLLIGRWLDAKTGKSPWFTIGGVILGGAAAIRSAYRTLTSLRRELGDGGDKERTDSRDKEK